MMQRDAKPKAARGDLSRRRVLGLGAGAALAGLVSACGSNGSGGGSVIGPNSPQVKAYAAAERSRFAHGKTVSHTLTAAPEQLDLGGVRSSGWVYNGQLPGPLIRATAGDRIQVRLHNQLPEATAAHWHGLAIRNDMDGVPDLTQPPVAAGASFDYTFIPADPGTYWYHTHGRLQRGRGLYGALIIDEPHEPGDYDAEFTVVLSDWSTHRTPPEIYDQLRHPKSGGMGNMSGKGMPGMGGMHGATSQPSMPSPSSKGSGMGGMGEMTSPALGGGSGDVAYPLYLLNGKPPNDPVTFTAKPGQRARIRLINASEDTAFRVALGGHQLTLTHTDGFGVEPVTGDAVLLAQGERYDATVTLQDGAFPLVAAAEGKRAQAFALVRTGSGRAPAPTTHPSQLCGRLLTVADLRATAADRLPAKPPQVTLRANLEGDMASYNWTINGRAYPDHTPLEVHQGQRVRLLYTNQTMMYHPMHLHGHTFALARPDGSGPRKDTTIVLPGKTVAADFDTDNPGQWFTHCHNEFHQAAGMATVLSYRS